MKLVGRILLSFLALVVATLLAGAILSRLHLSPPPLLPGTTPGGLFVASLYGGLLLVASLVPIASGLGGRFPVRWVSLGLLLYVATGVNTVVELSVFGTSNTGLAFMLVHYFVSFAAVTAALAWLFGSQKGAASLPQFGFMSWLWRAAAAWLAWPVIYFVFGMCVAPIVVPHYVAGVAGLRIPPIDVIFRTQLVRSVLFLGSSLPVILLWTSSRRRLMVALGIAHTVMVGLYGLSMASWMPMVLRVTHSVEITADSFAYALVLALLFFPRGRVAASTVGSTSLTSAQSTAGG
jgi:hypothetical protein